MIDLVLLLTQAVGAGVQQDLGAKVFATSCAVGYCHGADGAANRGPRLRGRNFERSHVEKAVRIGIPNSAMPGFEDRLKKDELAAVISYVLKISGAKADVSPADTSLGESPVPRRQSRAEVLAFDAAREVRCASCHEFRGKGTKIAPVAAGTLKRVTLHGGESFPGVVASESGDMLRVYDLTAPPPVLRTIAKDDVASTGPEKQWRHADVTKEYTVEEFEEVARYLRGSVP